MRDGLERPRKAARRLMADRGAGEGAGHRLSARVVGGGLVRRWGGEADGGMAPLRDMKLPLDATDGPDCEYLNLRVPDLSEADQNGLGRSDRNRPAAGGSQEVDGAARNRGGQARQQHRHARDVAGSSPAWLAQTMMQSSSASQSRAPRCQRRPAPSRTREGFRGLAHDKRRAGHAFNPAGQHQVGLPRLGYAMNKMG